MGLSDDEDDEDEAGSDENWKYIYINYNIMKQISSISTNYTMYA